MIGVAAHLAGKVWQPPNAAKAQIVPIDSAAPYNDPPLAHSLVGCPQPANCRRPRAPAMRASGDQVPRRSNGRSSSNESTLIGGRTWSRGQS